MIGKIGAKKTFIIGGLVVLMVAFFLLSYPQTDMIIQTVHGPKALHIGLTPWMFTALLFVVGVAMAVGKASVF